MQFCAEAKLRIIIRLNGSDNGNGSNSYCTLSSTSMGYTSRGSHHLCDSTSRSPHYSGPPQDCGPFRAAPHCDPHPCCTPTSISGTPAATADSTAAPSTSGGNTTHQRSSNTDPSPPTFFHDESDQSDLMYDSRDHKLRLCIL